MKYCKRTQTVHKPVSEVPQISLCHVNVRSVRNKTLCISDFITDHELDILALTETWLKDDSKEQLVLGELLAYRYSNKSLPREGDKKGGGVTFIYKDTYSVHVKHVERHTSFESLHVEVTVNSVLLRLLVIYSHLPKSGNAAEGDLFLSEFSEMVDSLLLCSGKVFIVGDFNYHVDDCKDTTIQNFLQLVDCANMVQYVKSPTHEKGHILDLILAWQDELLVSNVRVDTSLPTDHWAVLCTISIPSKTMQ